MSYSEIPDKKELHKQEAYDGSTISQAIHTEWAGKTVHFAKETDSTNTWVKRLAAEGAPHGTLAVAEYQSAGRGRFERSWKAPKGSSVMMSLLLRPQIPPQYASMLTLVMGLSVAQAVEQAAGEAACAARASEAQNVGTCGEEAACAARVSEVQNAGTCGEEAACAARAAEAQNAGTCAGEAAGDLLPGARRPQTGIKWPNDVVVSRKKICGILTEMSVLGMDIHYVVIGVGINVNIREFPPELEDKATSLCLETGGEASRVQVIALVMEYFEKNYELFIKTCDLSALKQEYQRLLVNLNEPVRVLDAQNPFEGICLGVDSQGRLLVKREDQSVAAVNAGEVSVRGLYSYV